MHASHRLELQHLLKQAVVLVELRANVLEQQFVDMFRANVVIAMAGGILERVLLFNLREYVHILPSRRGDAPVTKPVLRPFWHLTFFRRMTGKAGSLVTAATIVIR